MKGRESPVISRRWTRFGVLWLYYTVTTTGLRLFTWGARGFCHWGWVVEALRSHATGLAFLADGLRVVTSDLADSARLARSEAC